MMFLTVLIPSSIYFYKPGNSFVSLLVGFCYVIWHIVSIIVVESPTVDSTVIFCIG